MKPLLFLLACAICFSSCSKTPSIVVGSKNFTEQLILGEIAAQQLERKLQIKVERKLDLGGTMLAHGALLKGQIDLYPEYTGTASSGILKQAIPSDPAQAYIQVKDAYLQRFHLVWLPRLASMTHSPWWCENRTANICPLRHCPRPIKEDGGSASVTNS